ncbi:MAG: hypothetical protein ACM3MK_03460 [Chitinophagales bacterium]
MNTYRKILSWFLCLVFIVVQVPNVFAATQNTGPLEIFKDYPGPYVSSPTNYLQFDFNAAIETNNLNAAQLNQLIKLEKINIKGKPNKAIPHKCEILNKSSNKYGMVGFLIIRTGIVLPCDGSSYQVTIPREAIRAKTTGTQLSESHVYVFHLNDKKSPQVARVTPSHQLSPSDSKIYVYFDESFQTKDYNYNFYKKTVPPENQWICMQQVDSEGCNIPGKYAPLDVEFGSNYLGIYVVDRWYKDNEIVEVPPAGTLPEDTQWELYIDGKYISDYFGNYNNEWQTFYFSVEAYPEYNAFGLSATDVHKKDNGDGTVDVSMTVYNIPAPAESGMGTNPIGAMAALTIRNKDGTKYTNSTYNGLPLPVPGRSKTSDFFATIWDTAGMIVDSATDEYKFGEDSRDASIAKKSTFTVRAPRDGHIVITKSGGFTITTKMSSSTRYQWMEEPDAFVLNMLDIFSAFFDFHKSLAKDKANTSLQGYVCKHMYKAGVNWDTYKDTMQTLLSEGDYNKVLQTSITITVKAIESCCTDPETYNIILNAIRNQLAEKFGKNLLKTSLKSLAAPALLSDIGMKVYNMLDINYFLYDWYYWLANPDNITPSKFGTLTIPVSEVPY